MIWNDTTITVDPPKKPKKITATRFATILGLNPWSTAFEMWCEITRTYQKPFKETIYTLAGKIIEPKQIAYMRKAYAMINLRNPTDVYGEGYFKKTYGDFFHDVPIFGGMWDSLLVDENGKPEAVLEFKTTKRSEDWANDIPEYYALQAALYAYLLGVDDVIMVASFLDSKDYPIERDDGTFDTTPAEAYVPTAKNTITKEFKVSERYPNFVDMVEKARAWWMAHVETGISPEFNEKKDAEILNALRTHNLNPDTDIDTLVAEAEALKVELDKAASAVADKEKRLKEITEIIKEHAVKQFRDGDKKVEIKGNTFTFTVSRSETTTIDKKALEADGLLEKYQKKSEQYRMSMK